MAMRLWQPILSHPLAVSNNACLLACFPSAVASSLCYTIAYSAAAYRCCHNMEEVYAQTPVRTASYDTRQARSGSTHSGGAPPRCSGVARVFGGVYWA